MLGKLATYLRMCGYDAAYAHEEGIEADEELRKVARREGRTLLTRDEELAARMADAILLESLEIEGQLGELAATGIRLELPDEPERCSVCNGRVLAVGNGQHPPYAPDDEEEIWQCRDCGQYFWKGSHWDRVRETLRKVRAE